MLLILLLLGIGAVAVDNLMKMFRQTQTEKVLEIVENKVIMDEKERVIADKDKLIAVLMASNTKLEKEIDELKMKADK